MTKIEIREILIISNTLLLYLRYICLATIHHNINPTIISNNSHIAAILYGNKARILMRIIPINAVIRKRAMGNFLFQKCIEANNNKHDKTVKRIRYIPILLCTQRSQKYHPVNLFRRNSMCMHHRLHLYYTIYNNFLSTKS